MTVPELLGLRGVGNDLDLIAAVRQGLPTSSVDAVVQAGLLHPNEVDRLVVPRHQVALRKQRDQPLSAAESDCLVRIARVLVVSQETFGNPLKASAWLRTPNRGLGGAVPLELLDTGEGARVVEDAILRLAHGIFA